MFVLFRNRKKPNRVAVESDNRDRIAKDIVIKCILLQQRWARFMQHHAEKLSGKWKVIILSLFCLCAGGFSLILIARGLMSNHSVSFRVSRFKTPLYIGKSGDEKTKAIVIVTKEEYEKMQRFRIYMDSLARSPSGKLLYQDILVDRPGLMDSLILIENIYQSKSKK